jgi:phage terminase small subunit
MPDAVITPTRRLTAKERKVFERVISEFDHLSTTDADMLTRYAETSARYVDALKETKKYPTVKQAVINRSTGNVTGYKEIRNPAFRTLTEAQSQLNSLSRRLLIDTASENKRLILQSKKSRAFTASEQADRSERDILASITEEQIETEIARNLRLGYMPWWCETYEMQRSFTLYWVIANIELGPDDPDDDGL